MARDPCRGDSGCSPRGPTECSECPQHGRPILEALRRNRPVPRGNRGKSKTVRFGLLAMGGAPIGPRGPCDEAWGGAVMG
jgi:hypothetical protein